MITLVPSPRDLGLHSPVIGPWFSSNSVTLGLPEDDLAVPLTLGSNVEWRPPVAGFLSFYIATATRPAGLACLRGPSGPAFSDGRLVAVFEVLPEAGERLAALMRALPTLGNPAVTGVATRPAIKTFALEFTAASPGLAFFDDKLPFPYPAGVDTDAKKLAYLGLAGSASSLGNAAAPMRDLFRPGVTLGSSQKLLTFPTSTDARLWVFDARGRAIDPGAAACWWLFLATQTTSGFNNLFADGIAVADQRTAPIASSADRLTVQLVNAHEGALDPAVLARVNAGGNIAGTGAIRFRGTGSGAVTLGFTAAPSGDAPDDLPLPRLAVLPDGRYDTTASLFADGPLDLLLLRDHVRVAVLGVEHHLIGQPRKVDDTAADVVKRRAADQQRASTRLLVDRAARPALLRTPDAIAASAIAALGLTDGGAPVTAGLVAPTLGLDWGPLAGAPANVAVPASLTSVAAAALTGGGTAAGSTVANQQALITVTVGAAAAGAWVRCWTQGFDTEKGERFRLDGGAGVVDAAGRARVVAPLADGDVAPSAPMGVDVLVVTAQGHKLFADQRFARPAPIGGAPVAAGSASGPFLLCEEGREVGALDGSAAIASGTTVVALGGTPALVDRLTLPAAARAAATFARAAAAGDKVQLTQPALVGAAQGDVQAALAAGGATVTRTARVLPSAWQAGFPLPGMERRELVAAATTANVSRATVGGGMALGNRHGLPAHADGHPMCPAGPDVVAVGADIQGPAVRGIAEYVRERTSANTIALATTAAGADLAVPAAPASDSLWIAGLRTVAAGVEAEVGLSTLLTSVFGDAYPFGAGLDAIKGFLSGAGVPLPTGISDTAGRVARALDRRFLAAARGAREGATALAAAINRAEDLIVLDTPAIDNRSFGKAPDDTIHLLQLLSARMDARPGLRVLLCLPVFFDASVPKALQRIRDSEARAALDALVTGDRERRVAVFSPSAGPGRSLKLATTAVVVDDAWAMVGTTHLWRRGLSYDSSYAVSVFDDRLEAGRPQEVLRFRRQLCADRLGIALGQVPDDPTALVDGVRALVTRGGFGRLVAERIRPPQEAPTTLNSGATFSEFDVWNPDGSPPDDFNPLTALLQLTPTAVTEAFATP